jgi:hypothetical protein
VFLAPLERYWLSPCCDDPGHLVNYREQSYLPRLNNSIIDLLDCIRDSLYTRRVSNYRVLCPYKMMGLGPRTGGISDSEAKKHADRCGGDPVHPSAAAYCKMAEDISEDLSNAEARYANPVKATFKPDHKRPRVEFSLQRDDWVSGCQLRFREPGHCAQCARQGHNALKALQSNARGRPAAWQRLANPRLAWNTGKGRQVIRYKQTLAPPEYLYSDYN